MGAVPAAAGRLSPACINVAGDFLNLRPREPCGLNNLWVGYISTPLSSAFILLALSAWHTVH